MRGRGERMQHGTGQQALRSVGHPVKSWCEWGAFPKPTPAEHTALPAALAVSQVEVPAASGLWLVSTSRMLHQSVLRTLY